MGLTILLTPMIWGRCSSLVAAIPRADPRVTDAWVQKYFWCPHMGVVVLLTPPLYKCFYGYDSNTEMLP